MAPALGGASRYRRTDLHKGLHTRGPLGLRYAVAARRSRALTLPARKARQQCDKVVLSIALQPAQFPSQQEYERYPRNISEDIAQLRESGVVDAILIPKPSEIFKYTAGHGAIVRLESSILPAEYFDLDMATGECTVLTKILNLVTPTRLYLGQRDLIRAKMIERLIDDLLLPVQVVTLPTIRDTEGLAYDGRLELLDPLEVQAARAIYRALKVMVAGYLQDIFVAAELVERGRKTLQVEPMLKIGFVRIAHPYGFQDIDRIDTTIGAVAAISVTVNDNVVLADNVILAPLIPAHEQSLWGLVRSVADGKAKETQQKINKI